MTCGKAVGQEICEESLPKLFNFLDKCASCEIRFSVFHGVEPGNQEEDEPMLNLRTEEERYEKQQQNKKTKKLKKPKIEPPLLFLFLIIITSVRGSLG